MKLDQSKSTVLVQSTSKQRTSRDVNLIQCFLEANSNVRFVRLHWVDLTGLTRMKVLTVEYFRRLAETRSVVSVSSTVLSILPDLSDDRTSNFDHVGQYDLIPDLTSIRLCGFRPTHASVLCDFARDGEIVRISPRAVLYKQIERSFKHDMHCWFGFEVEFVILSKNGDIPNNEEPDYTLNLSHSTAERLEVLETIVGAMARSLIGVGHFEAKRDTSQYEIATSPLPCLPAIDALVLSKETVYHTCSQHGLRATFHPKLDDNAFGTGADFHFSLEHLNLEPHFIAGILAHLRAVCAFTLPSVVSYDRIRDSRWTGGVWLTWGTLNRETPLRKIRPGRWEFKSIDATANMYLAIAAILAAGLEGVAKKMPLNHVDCQGNSFSLFCLVSYLLIILIKGLNGIKRR
jgi:glutamine synthetase